MDRDRQYTAAFYHHEVNIGYPAAPDRYYDSEKYPAEKQYGKHSEPFYDHKVIVWHTAEADRNDHPEADRHRPASVIFKHPASDRYDSSAPDRQYQYEPSGNCHPEAVIFEHPASEWRQCTETVQQQFFIDPPDRYFRAAPVRYFKHPAAPDRNDNYKAVRFFVCPSEHFDRYRPYGQCCRRQLQ